MESLPSLKIMVPCFETKWFLAYAPFQANFNISSEIIYVEYDVKKLNSCFTHALFKCDF